MQIIMPMVAHLDEGEQFLGKDYAYIEFLCWANFILPPYSMIRLRCVVGPKNVINFFLHIS